MLTQLSRHKLAQTRAKGQSAEQNGDQCRENEDAEKKKEKKWEETKAIGRETSRLQLGHLGG